MDRRFRFVGAMFLGVWDLVALPFLVALSVSSRLRQRRGRVGLGPQPAKRYIYLAEALRSAGYEAETFVDRLNHVSHEYDWSFDRSNAVRFAFYLMVKPTYVLTVMRYDAIIINFNGGPLGLSPWLWRIEPWLLRLARVRTVVIPMGADVHDLRRSMNRAVVDAYAHDYPEQWPAADRIARKVRVWQRQGTVIYSGCDWVDYVDSWDRLVPHLCVPISTPFSGTQSGHTLSRPLRVLHVTNHPALKGTADVELAVRKLQQSGSAIELVLLERASGEEVRARLAWCDVVVDQLVIGWYGVFAMEAMAMARPVLTYLDPRYVDLYRREGVISDDEPPLLSVDADTLALQLQALVDDRSRVTELGEQALEYVSRYHSLSHIGSLLASDLASASVLPHPGRGTHCYDDLGGAGAMLQHHRQQPSRPTVR